MKTSITFGILAFSTLAATLGFTAIQDRKTSDGVYTNEQADRGQQLVTGYGCQNCHGASLEGGLAEEPPLQGEQFFTSWTGRKVDELAEKLTTMPADRGPGDQVKPQEAADIVSYLLRYNGFPAGAEELPADLPSLKRIEIVGP